MRIVHVLAPAHAGGLERVVHSLAIGQQRAGHHVMVLPVVDEWSGDHPFAAPLVRADVEIHPLIVPARAYIREWDALARVFQEAVPDVVHTHGYHADVIAGWVARRAGLATVSTAHGFTRGSLRNRLYETLCRFALRRFDAVAAVSRPLAEELERSKVPADRIHIVPNGWSSICEPLDRATARRELGLDPEQFIVGWVGRMTREKGLDILVDSLTTLTDLPIGVCAIGDGPERHEQERRASVSGVAERIHWAGLVREAGRYFRAFDVLVISSRTEGLPMVLLEAFASGVPLVATAVGGIPDVASSREALLVPPERAEALGSAVRSVFTRPDEAGVRAGAARARLDREFAEGAWLDRYEEVYQIARERAHGRVTI